MAVTTDAVIPVSGSSATKASIGNHKCASLFQEKKFMLFLQDTRQDQSVELPPFSWPGIGSKGGLVTYALGHLCRDLP